MAAVRSRCGHYVSVLFMAALQKIAKNLLTIMWAIAQRDGRPAEYRRRPLLNAAKFR